MAFIGKLNTPVLTAEARLDNDVMESCADDVSNPVVVDDIADEVLSSKVFLDVTLKTLLMGMVPANYNGVGA
jgi:hypothetical protein